MTLTDRYIDAVLVRLPHEQRAEIEQELRASIADAMEDQTETEVLTELGDPARLAASYADRPLQLIGPRFYLDYVRLLKALLLIIVPAAAGLVGLLKALDGGPAGGIVTATLGAAFTAAFHVLFWTTLVFALIERIPALQVGTGREWTPDDLPDPPPSRRARFGELTALTVITALMCTFVLLSPRLGFEKDSAGEPIGLLSPWLWDTGVIYVFLGIVLINLALVYARHYAKWTVPLSIGAALLDIASPLLLIWLTVTDHVLNPAFVQAAGWSAGTVRWINIALIVTSIGTIIQYIFDALKRTPR